MELKTRVEISAHGMVRIFLPQEWQHPSAFSQLRGERGLPLMNVYFRIAFAGGAIATIRRIAEGLQDHPEIVATLERIEQRILVLQATWRVDHPVRETVVVPMKLGLFERRGQVGTC